MSLSRTPDFALLAGMPDASFSRIVAVAVWFVVCALLTFAVKPDRRNLCAAAATGLTVAVFDFAAEIVAGWLGLWRYRMEGTWLGLPPDLLLDIFALGYSFCLAWIAVERRYHERRHAVLFILLTGLVMGTVAFIHNLAAERQGFVEFGNAVKPGTPLFVAGNYLLMTAVSAGVMLLFRFYRHELNRKPGQ